jgi:hypothetical protein
LRDTAATNYPKSSELISSEISRVLPVTIINF